MQPLRRVMQWLLLKLKVHLSYNPAVVFKYLLLKNTYICFLLMFTAALYVMKTIWKLLHRGLANDGQTANST